MRVTEIYLASALAVSIILGTVNDNRQDDVIDSLHILIETHSEFNLEMDSHMYKAIQQLKRKKQSPIMPIIPRMSSPKENQHPA